MGSHININTLKTGRDRSPQTQTSSARIHSPLERYFLQYLSNFISLLMNIIYFRCTQVWGAESPSKNKNLDRGMKLQARLLCVGPQLGGPRRDPGCWRVSRQLEHRLQEAPQRVPYDFTIRSFMIPGWVLHEQLFAWYKLAYEIFYRVHRLFQPLSMLWCMTQACIS